MYCATLLDVDLSLRHCHQDTLLHILWVRQIKCCFRFLCSCSSAVMLQQLVKLVFGCLSAVACGMLYAVYLSTYHDRKFWFSSRQVGCTLLSSPLSLFAITVHPPFIAKFHPLCCILYLRSWRGKSPSREAVGSIITTTNTC